MAAQAQRCPQMLPVVRKSYPETDQKRHLKVQSSKLNVSRLPYSSKMIEGCPERIDRVGHYLEVFKELTSLHCQFLAQPQDASALVKITLENGTQPGTQQLAPPVSAAQSTTAGSVAEQTTYLSQDDRSVYHTDKFSLQCSHYLPSFGKNLRSRRRGSCRIEHLHGYASQKKQIICLRSRRQITDRFRPGSRLCLNNEIRVRPASIGPR